MISKHDSMNRIFRILFMFCFLFFYRKRDYFISYYFQKMKRYKYLFSFYPLYKVVHCKACVNLRNWSTSHVAVLHLWITVIIFYTGLMYEPNLQAGNHTSKVNLVREKLCLVTFILCFIHMIADWCYQVMIYLRYSSIPSIRHCIYIR